MRYKYIIGIILAVAMVICAVDFIAFADDVIGRKSVTALIRLIENPEGLDDMAKEAAAELKKRINDDKKCDKLNENEDDLDDLAKKLNDSKRTIKSISTAEQNALKVAWNSWKNRKKKLGQSVRLGTAMITPGGLTIPQVVGLTTAFNGLPQNEKDNVAGFINRTAGLSLSSTVISNGIINNAPSLAANDEITNIAIENPSAFVQGVSNNLGITTAAGAPWTQQAVLWTAPIAAKLGMTEPRDVILFDDALDKFRDELGDKLYTMTDEQVIGELKDRGFPIDLIERNGLALKPEYGRDATISIGEHLPADMTIGQVSNMAVNVVTTATGFNAAAQNLRAEYSAAGKEPPKLEPERGGTIGLVITYKMVDGVLQETYTFTK